MKMDHPSYHERRIRIAAPMLISGAFLVSLHLALALVEVLTGSVHGLNRHWPEVFWIGTVVVFWGFNRHFIEYVRSIEPEPKRVLVIDVIRTAVFGLALWIAILYVRKETEVQLLTVVLTICLPFPHVRHAFSLMAKGWVKLSALELCAAVGVIVTGVLLISEGAAYVGYFIAPPAVLIAFLLCAVWLVMFLSSRGSKAKDQRRKQMRTPQQDRDLLKEQDEPDRRSPNQAL